MNDCGREGEGETEAILNKIAADFEALDRMIETAIALLKTGDGSNGTDLAALEKARDAARKGAALARGKVVTD
jgi:hypothetical protein